MSVKQVLKNAISSLKKKDVIVYESVPDLTDNTYMLFLELQRRGYGKHYRSLWLVKDKKAAKEFAKGNPLFENTKFYQRKGNLSAKVFRWKCIRAKCLISCNEFLTCFDDKQISFFLTHGTGIKQLHNYVMPDGIDYCLTASEELIPMTARELKYPAEKIVITGFPRNDILFEKPVDLKKYFGDFDKFICWYPTFRQSTTKSVQNVNEHAFPVIHDAKKASELNDYAREKGVLIIVKPHYAQDVSYITDLNLSNIRIVKDSFFEENGFSSYEFMASCDSLITDYSSIYFDYLLCDKPIAVCWEDIDEYTEYPGFSLDVNDYMSCTHKIYTLPDFYKYLDEIASGVDSMKEERGKINCRANKYTDGKSAKRVADFIVEKAGLSL